MKGMSVDPVGLPGLAALALGFVVFAFALLRARRRRAAAAEARESARARRSWLWIGVQALAFLVTGIGPIDVALDPLGIGALVEAAFVLVLMLVGAALFEAASRAMGANWSLVARIREDHRLIENGPFGVIRHPIYVALFLLLLAIAVAYGHGRSLVLAVPLYAIGTGFRVRHEETLLRRQFGGAYLAYAARVKRFVPGLF